MKNIDDLTQLLSRFPGIGKRQAQRMVYFLLEKGPRYTQTLVEGLNALHTHSKQCVESYQYFYSENNETRAPIARDPSRDRTSIMVVEKDSDLESIEKSGAYRGTYFVLGGLLPVIEGTAPSGVRDAELLAEITRRAKEENLKEVIFGLSLNPESEHTRITLSRQLQPIAKEHQFTLSQLGRGLSTGTELEYSDQDTIASALASRTTQ